MRGNTMRTIHGWVLVLLAGVLLSACSLPGFGAGTVDDGPPIPITEEAAASLEQKAIAAGQEAQAGGSSSITVTQEEITSYVALRLLTAAQDNSTVPLPISEPQIYFKESGELVLRGNLEFQGRSQPLRVAARPTAVDGALQVDVTEGSIGPVPVPGIILDQTEGLLADAILSAQDYARLDAVSVQQGTLTLQGQRAP